MLHGNWGLERYAVAIPKGLEKALPFLTGVTQSMIADGIVKDAVARAGQRSARVPAMK